MALTRVPLRLVFSYVLDWAIVIIIAVAGGVLNYISGFHRPFSLTDIDISYPHKADIVSLPVLVAVSLVAPFGTIIVLCLVSYYLGATSYNSRRRGSVQLLWEIHAGLIGLCAGLAVTLFITSGLKDLVGKPRPSLISVCHADPSAIPRFLVGGFGDSLDSEASALVSSGICRQSDKRMLDDSFAAFPSGHSSFSCAGLIYMSLWLCAKFSLKIPYLDHKIDNPRRITSTGKLSTAEEQAAPPLWQLAIALTPTAVAFFICASRYADFHHAGIDIFCGAVIGTVLAFSSFRLYHLPMRRSRGLLAWGERSMSRAFFQFPVKFKGDTDAEIESPIDIYTSGGAGESHEMGDIEGMRNPVRADTYSSSSPIVEEPRLGR